MRRRRRYPVIPRWCEEWPRCRCHEKIEHWQHAIMHDETLTLEALTWAATDMMLALSCVEHSCHDAEARRWASRELEAPIMRREKMKWLAEGGFE